jgi:erythrin-vacuolar iron transport family protein
MSTGAEDAGRWLFASRPALEAHRMTEPRSTSRAAVAQPRATAALAMLLRMIGMTTLAARLDRSTGSSHVVDEEASRSFVLRIVQPGLAGLMDGSVSTLAPIFATAFVTGNPFDAFRVGMAAALGAGISMAFAEALSDSGELTGRGSPWLRGTVTGGMTFLGGSLHTLPFLLPNVHTALFAAYIVVAIELVVIAAIRHRFFGTNWGLSILQVVGGGALVFIAAVIFGHA